MRSNLLVGQCSLRREPSSLLAGRCNRLAGRCNRLAERSNLLAAQCSHPAVEFSLPVETSNLPVGHPINLPAARLINPQAAHSIKLLEERSANLRAAKSQRRENDWLLRQCGTTRWM
ncbi:MAG: hypothetical protein ABSF38_21330 [Verrucomicrobiota bacterium]